MWEIIHYFAPRLKPVIVACDVAPLSTVSEHNVVAASSYDFQGLIRWDLCSAWCRQANKIC